MTKPQTQSESKPETSPKLPRKRRRNVKFELPKIPALPVKALWEMATPEQRKQAHETSITIMEYWLGKITKQEMAARLKMPPLRTWQLCQQAISGMVAGLLIQPKARAPRGSKGQGLDAPQKPENNPKLLRDRIEKLERTVEMQERLISVLREMPGCKDAKIPMETPQTETSEGAAPNATSRATRAAAAPATGTPKATSPVPAGARHEAQSGANGPSPDHSAKKLRSGG